MAETNRHISADPARKIPEKGRARRGEGQA
jgi:hypothetical protein